MKAEPPDEITMALWDVFDIARKWLRDANVFSRQKNLVALANAVSKVEGLCRKASEEVGK